MCVEQLGKRVKGPVTAYKLFYVVRGKLRGLRDFKYKTGSILKTKDPGFQAFVNKKDAEYSSESAWTGTVVRKVMLWDVAKGTIFGMSFCADGRKGWSAHKMKILGKIKK